MVDLEPQPRLCRGDNGGYRREYLQRSSTVFETARIKKKIFI